MTEEEKRAQEIADAVKAADEKKRKDALKAKAKADAEAAEKEEGEKKAKEEAEKKAAADAEGTKLDKVLAHLDGIKSMCDSFKARLDALDGGDVSDPGALSAPAADARADAAKNARADALANTQLQARADEVYNAHGQQAPRHLYGETPMNYRIRLLGGLKCHSQVWKNVDLHKIAADAAALDAAEAQIFADATAEGLSPKNFADESVLYERITPDASGRRIRTFHGRHTFIHQLAARSRLVERINTRVADHAP